MTEQRPTTERRCPRCGAVLPQEAFYERLGCATPERVSAWRIRHQTERGWCVAYAGPERREGPG